MTKEILAYCEGCASPIYDGDAYNGGPDASLCIECAPDYSDLLANPSLFLDQDEEPLTAAAAQEIVDAHLAKGGNLSDKVVK
ncbi:hypothetical protein [Brucella sp. 2716]|uniref:hypothetical protein n=1 Tax=Brucella sp. 2716 TaxID=2975052 RepID=UPI00217E1F78|nr:hypothetical protein [Brucella sp. 2716]UWF58027.1 hypothetical protein NYO66_05425 [Brucella sp. 2716]